MQHIQQLVQGLNKSEKKMVRKFLASFSSNGKSETLSLELFDLLNKKKRKLSNKECSEILFGKDEKNRIRVLKSRFKARVLDALSTDIILENQFYDDDVKISIQLKKKLSQFQFLYYSGKQGQEIALTLLTDVIEKSSIYEHYSIHIEALQIKKLLLGIREGIESFEDYNDQIILAENSFKTKSFMVNNYYRMILTYRNKSPNYNQIKEKFPLIIKEGKTLLSLGNSQIGRYYFNIIQYAYFSEIKNYNQAIKIMNNQLSLLNTSKIVFRKGRLGATYDYLCQTNLKLGNYKSAGEYAQKGKEYFKKGELNYSVAEELEYRSYLFSQNLENAELCITNMRKIYQDKLDVHRLSTHKFFLANLYFSKGEFKKCNRLLAENYEFKKDKMGWEFNLKLLGIMCLIEQNKLEIAFNKLENLSRSITKYGGQDGNPNIRNQLIIKLLKKWLIDGGNQSIAKMKNSSLLIELNNSKNEWDPLSSEMIEFSKWFKNKV